jgi:uncharacterized membrane protein YqjE
MPAKQSRWQQVRLVLLGLALFLIAIGINNLVAGSTVRERAFGAFQLLAVAFGLWRVRQSNRAKNRDRGQE